MLLAYGIKTWVSLCEPVQRPVVGEGRAYEHDVIELAAERATELVHKKLRLARICGANDERVERDDVRVHFINTAKVAFGF